MKESDEKPKLKKKLVRLIEGAHVLRRNGQSPCIHFDGDAPEAGQKVVFVHSNGITYGGTVAATTVAGENVLVEFVDGIKPVQPK